MIKESKIYYFIDRKDFVKNVNSDNVINIIGTKGSGKTTNTLKYIDNDEFIVVNCDKLLDMPIDDIFEDKFLSDIIKLLKDKYGNIPEGNEFLKCYNDIVDFCEKKNRKLLIEGNLLYDIDPITNIKGTVIVKRTGVLKCFFRTIKRDYPNKYFLDIEIKEHGKVLGRLFRLKNIIKRRTKIFKEVKFIESIIDSLIDIKEG